MRLAVLPYINAFPLVEKLDRVPRIGALVPTLPSIAYQILASGQVEAAIIPVAQLLEHQHDLNILGPLGICSQGPVQSVLLKSQCPLHRIQTIAPDPASRSSNALVRVLCCHFWGLDDRITWVDPSIDVDARVVIGDAALRSSPSPYTYDLAEIWRQQTGLPFVFAVWACRKETANQQELESSIYQAYQLGRRSMPELIGKAAQRSGLDIDRCRRYLTESLYYELGSPEFQAITLFHQLYKNRSCRHHSQIKSTPQTGISHDQGFARIAN